MRRISELRFNAIAGYARQPMARVMAEEVGWFELRDHPVLGAVIRDREDNDFSGLVFAQDAKLRFRWVSGTDFYTSMRRAEVALRRAMEAAALAPPEDHHQGDEQGEPVDFFAPIKPEADLHQDFRNLTEQEGYSPAKEIIEPMMRWYEDVDGNFIEQFQTTGFDQRIWELYLFAALTEMGYEDDDSEVAPDFLCSGFAGEFALEAVTVGPTKNGNQIVPPPPTSTPAEVQAYLNDYMPIKFGSALYSKLQKRYWELPHVNGKPLILAVEDFSSPGSMMRTRSALQKYIYGYNHEVEFDADGNLVLSPIKIEKHVWGKKEIPSGYFDLDGAENISAILFSNSGTISKFDRMGILGGFGSDRVLLIRKGTRVDHDPNTIEPIQFAKVVNDPRYSETWVEGLDVFHNPRAINPVPQDSFPGAAHHYIEADGKFRSFTPDWHPLGSFTMINAPVNVEEAVAYLRDANT